MRKKVAVLIEAIRGHERHLMLGIAKYARMKNNWIFYLDKEDPFYKDFASGKHNLKEKLESWGVNGIITRHPDTVKELSEKGIPVVIVKEIPKGEVGWNSINIDNQAIGTMAAKHLLERGFRNFGFCGLDDEFFWSKTRGESFAKTIIEAGAQISYYTQPRRLDKLSWEFEQNILAQWIKSLPKPVGIMACNDDRAEHVMEACKAIQVNVPEDVAVIGVDNDELICEFSNPPLSSVSLNSEQAGFEAAEVLDLMMMKKNTAKKRIIVLPTQVATRQSTDVLAIEDREVARAIAYIRERSHMDISAESVSEYMGLSLRVLQKKFRKAIGWSVRDELKRARMTRIKRMLLETNMTISQIADVLGYASNHNMSRFFKKECKSSPQAFRKEHII
jgi:LacI family transcriptional regulator